MSSRIEEKIKWFLYRLEKVVDDGGQAVPIDLANVIGVFYVLFVGIATAMVHALITFLWEIFKQSKQLKVCQQLIAARILLYTKCTVFQARILISSRVHL